MKKEQIVDKLCIALHHTLQQLPFLAGSMVSNSEEKDQGHGPILYCQSESTLIPILPSLIGCRPDYHHHHTTIEIGFWQGYICMKTSEI